MQWLDFLFPPTCPSCGSEVWHDGEWCKTCFEELYDVRCITDLEGQNLTCVYVIGHYDKGLKSILRDIKFRGQKERAVGVAPFLYSFMLALAKYKLTPDYVMPIPVSETKRKLRGYNQVDILFKNWIQQVALHNQTSWQWIDGLEKNDSTHAMFSLGRTERHENMKHAFTPLSSILAKNILKDKVILLVDDIFTTGATLEAAAQVLVKDYKVKEVVGLALAGGH